MGSYGIGLGRLMACIIEGHHDDLGIVWPVAVAPYDAHLVSLARPGWHLRNVNVPRDFEPDLYADLTLARAGDACPRCCVPLEVIRAIEVGHVFQLGTKYAEALHATFLDESGTARPVVMGSYGIGLGRLMACIIEGHHDDLGIVWPVAVAPYDAHLVSLARPGTAEEQAAEALYVGMRTAGLDVLYDDRPERAGVKFNDADLLGVPVRLTLSPRTLATGAVELKLRREAEPRTVPLEPIDGLVAAIRAVG
jgi:prolyl-tRNA synthetase